MQIHDHFDGSAHCRECAGPCRLQGDERLLTDVVRLLLEWKSIPPAQGWLPDSLAKPLDILINGKLSAMRVRAQKSMQAIYGKRA